MSKPYAFWGFKRGRCVVCGKNTVERSQRCEGPTATEAWRAAEAWEKTPIVHKRCEAAS